MEGAIHRHSMAVIIPSRPKIVLNQGTPAYGYAPSGFPSINIRRSASERVNHSLKCLLEVLILHPSRMSFWHCRFLAAKASVYDDACFWADPRSQMTVSCTMDSSFGFIPTWYFAVFSVSECGVAEK